MSPTKPLALILACAALGALAQAAGAPANGEKWQVTTSMKAMGMSMPGQTTTLCKDPKDDSPPLKQQDDCEVYDLHRSGNTQTFKMRCTGKQKMEGSGTVTYSGDSYHGSMEMRAGKDEMAMEYDGHKLGKCDGSELNVRAEAQSKQVQAQLDAYGKMAKEQQARSAAEIAKACNEAATRADSPYPFMASSTGGGFCKDDAAHRQQFCKSAQGYAGYDRLAQREAEMSGNATPGYANPEGKPLTDAGTLCGFKPEATRAALCARADADRQYDYMSAWCPAEAEVVARRECAGRSYTTSAPELRKLCAAAAKRDGSPPAQDAKAPDAKQGIEDKLKKGKDKLKGLLGF